MRWQDWIISVGNFVLAAALIPSIISGNTPALITSGMTAIILYLFGVSFLSLKLKMSALAVSLSASMWVILFIQGVLCRT